MSIALRKSKPLYHRTAAEDLQTTFFDLPRRYDTRSDMRFAKDAPVVGLVLQRSHLVTGDEGHYSGVVASLEAQGAKVGLDLG